MPTYEYECEKCGQRFEAFQSITAEPLTKCTKEGCDGNVKRLFSTGGGFIFKGSGFYITDYRSDSYKRGAQSDSTSAASPSTNHSKKQSASTSAAATSSASSSTPSTGGSTSSGSSSSKAGSAA
jgi:putative FmdB family regulatory protein